MSDSIEIGHSEFYFERYDDCTYKVHMHPNAGGAAYNLLQTTPKTDYWRFELNNIDNLRRNFELLGMVEIMKLRVS